MRIERIRLRNYKLFRDVTIDDIPGFCVLVGANGTGKSTLFDVIGFLRDCLKDNVRSALAKRGSFKEVVTRGSDTGATITIELKLRMELPAGWRTVTYLLEIGQDKSLPIVEREVLSYTRFGGGKPYRFLDFRRGEGNAITNEEEFKSDKDIEREPRQLDSPDILAIKGLGQFQRFRAASAFRSLIENWHVSDFHIQAARGSQDAGYAEHLSPSGENLPLVAQFLFQNQPELFRKILASMVRRVPGVSSVEPAETEDGRLVLRFHDGSFKDPFISRYVSDGTIKMFAYLALLHDPKPHPLLCVEEPENQLYPLLLGELAEEFDAYARRGGQVFVTTHSPDFLNNVPLQSIFVMEKRLGFTAVRRAEEDQNLSAMTREGDSIGALWRQGMLTERSAR